MIALEGDRKIQDRRLQREREAIRIYLYEARATGSRDLISQSYTDELRSMAVSIFRIAANSGYYTIRTPYFGSTVKATSEALLWQPSRPEVGLPSWSSA